MSLKDLFIVAAVVFFCLVAAGVTADWASLGYVGLACFSAAFFRWPF